jgi:hypothetical protein
MATIFPPEGPSEELTRGLARRAYTVDKLRTLLQRSAEKGELKPDTDIDAAAWIIYDIFLTELRYWLAAEKPDPRAGLARYRHLLEIILSGLINTSGRKRKR